MLSLVTDPPMKENPYEDVELHGRCLGKKCVLTFPASPTSSIPDTSTKVLAWACCLTALLKPALSTELPKVPLGA